MTRDNSSEMGALAHPARRRILTALGGAALAGVAGLTMPAGSSAAGRGLIPALHVLPALYVRDGQIPDGWGGSHVYGRHGPDSQHQALLDAALRCVSAGEACLASGASDAVAAMIASCRAVAHALDFSADAFEDAVGRSAGTCAACEAVCRTQEDRAAFRICADACANFLSESRKLTRI